MGEEKITEGVIVLMPFCFYMGEPLIPILLILSILCFVEPWIINKVMMQPHNRQMSFSLYISALAVSDTMVVLTGKFLSILIWHLNFYLASLILELIRILQ